MFTDMVGYSALIGRNEALGLELLAEHRGVVRDILARHRGREVDTAGDAFFVEFGSALDATNCAIEIQTALHARNEEQPVDRHIVLRIGLHLGDVVHIGDQVQGDGVNIAARMEPLAKPGSICVSEDVARQVHNKIDLPLAPLGRKRLKNIKLPMSAYCVVMPWEKSADELGTGVGLGVSETKLLSGRVRRPLSIAVGVILLATTAWLILNGTRGESDSAGRDVSSSLVAVLPFTVQGTPDFAYLGKGMVDLLSTKLDGAGVFQAVDPRAIMGIVDQSGDESIDPSDAGAIARSLGAGNYVMGNIVEVDGQLRIDAAIYAGEKGGQAAQGTVEGTASDIFDLLDRLAAQLVVSSRGGSDTPLERLDALTTTSFSALKHYLQGVNEFRAARFQSAVDELSRAVAEDSTFALAWYQLSATAEWLFDPVLALDAVKQAAKYSDRLSKRGKSLVEALEAAKSGRNDEAYQLYREFVTRYPDDVEAWYQLGELVFHAGPMIGVPPQESLVAWKRLLFFEPDQVTALIHMARVAVLEGKAVRVDSTSNVVFTLEPGAERNAELRIHVAFNRQDEAAIERALAELRDVSDDMLMDVLWSVASFRKRLEPAMLVAEVMSDQGRPEEVRDAGLIAQAYLHAATGRFSDASTVLDQAAVLGNRDEPAHRAYLTTLPFREPSQSVLDETIRRLTEWDAGSAPTSAKSSGWYSVHNGIHEEIRSYMLGILAAVEGDSVAANRFANRLESVDAPVRTGSLLPDLAVGIKGQVALSAGRYPDGEDLLSMAKRHTSYQYAVSSPFFSEARERFLFATLLARHGDYEDAIRAFDFFEGHSLYDLVFAAPSHLRRADIFRELGDLHREMEHLKRFVDLWRDCDEEFKPAVTEAQHRLAELSASSSD